MSLQRIEQPAAGLAYPLMSAAFDDLKVNSISIGGAGESDAGWLVAPLNGVVCAPTTIPSATAPLAPTVDIMATLPVGQVQFFGTGNPANITRTPGANTLRIGVAGVYTVNAGFVFIPVGTILPNQPMVLGLFNEPPGPQPLGPFAATLVTAQTPAQQLAVVVSGGITQRYAAGAVITVSAATFNLPGVGVALNGVANGAWLSVRRQA